MTGALAFRNEAIRRVDVLGVGISVINMDTAVAEIKRWIDEGRREYVCITGVHGVMESQRDHHLKEIHNNSGMTTPDGMPMVWSSRWAGATPVSRVYGPDLMLEVCKAAETTGWKSYFYGGAEGVPDLLAARLRAWFPELMVVGTCSPPYRPLTTLEDSQMIAQINRAEPEIVWVGLGTPKQEQWMAEHREQLNAPVLVGVGAAFDLHAGIIAQSPRWMQRHGLEWLYRLSREPGRLWKRYLFNNPRFVAAVIRRPPRLVEPN